MMMDEKSGAVGRKMLPAVGILLAGFLFWEPALADTAAVVEKHVTNRH
ncbi:MAG: hypothetical protein U5K27_12935 [Desulfotignum sp.]|nr:hypothetical protein [Desulfotignum sp.]